MPMLIALKAVLARVWDWCQHHRELLAAALGAFAAVYAASRRGNHAAAEKEQADESAADTVLSIKEIAIEQGAAAAHQKVAEVYKDALANLTKEQQDKASELAADPVKLAQYLVDQNVVAP